MTIDFDKTDAQTAACARLLVAVIALAIDDADASIPKKGRDNKNSRAAEAMRFLFSERSVFPCYASLLGLPIEGVRQALLNRKNIRSRFAAR